jgi:hypothetical protein
MRTSGHLVEDVDPVVAAVDARGGSLLEVEMGKDQLAVLRGAPEPRSPRPTNTPIATVSDEWSPAPHPLSILALASSIRLDDARQEHERVVLVQVGIMAGREAARVLDRWLSQSLAEYRGSRSRWDLEATTAELRVKLDQFEEILRDNAERLMALIPGLVSGIPGVVSLSASRPRRRRALDEVAAVSGLADAIEPQTASRATRAESSQPSSDIRGSGG